MPGAVVQLSEAQEAIEALPALVDRAAQTLLSARDQAEYMEARATARFAYDASKSIGRMVKAHDELVAAAHRAQADALVIEAQAKYRLAAEYNAAQNRGEVATRADQNLLPEQKKVSVGDIGLTHKDIYDARRIHDAEEAEPGFVRRVMDDAIQRGAEPSRAELNRALDSRMERHAEQAETVFNQRADEADFKRFRKLWKEMRPGAQALARAWLDAQ